MVAFEWFYPRSIIGVFLRSVQVGFLLPLGWFDVESLANTFGPWTLLVACGMIFAETGLLIGFFLPGDTLLITIGLLTSAGSIGVPIWLTCCLVSAAAYIGGDVGYFIGRLAGPKLFEKDSRSFAKKSAERTSEFFRKYGVLTVTIARFFPIIRTFAPVAAGISKMRYSVYSICNLLGAVIWGTGVTLLGFFLAGIPIVRDNIEIAILLAVGLVILSAVLHYVTRGKKNKSSSKERT
ncbi:MAG: VTT domain-containing protein [Tropheryma whipplei]|nr:VTT domain-containing protein [Tropheryma whipplei]